MKGSQAIADRDKIRNWLIGDGFAVTEQTEQGLSWFLVATSEDGRGFGISRAVGKTEVYIRVRTEFDATTTAVLAGMNESDRRRFYDSARFTLLALDAEFQPEGDPLWLAVTFSRRIFPDALTRDTFFERLFAVHKSATALGWMINTLAAQLPPPIVH